MTEQHPSALFPIPEDCDVLIPAAPAPDYLGVQRQTLARWRHEGQGPKFVKLGRRLVAYRAGDLREWIQAQLRENTITKI